MTTLLLISTLLTTYLHSVIGQLQCATPDGSSGKCVSIHDCSTLLDLVWTATPAEEDFLRSSLCGFVRSTPWVCCPLNTCTTPIGARGTCVGLHACPQLTSMLQSNFYGPAMEYVQRSRCEVPGSYDYNVCCASENLISVPIWENNKGGSKCQLTAFPPDPNTECCGIDSSSGDNRIVGGKEVGIDEYPWLALIEYAKGNKIKLLCGGSLISGQYVLTAGHCLKGPVLNSGKPVNVRLGEYDTSNYDADCVEVEGGGQDCNDGTVIVPIQYTITHPKYNPNSNLRRHDIALVRLNRIVEFTDFVRPICLPTTDFTKGPAVKETLYAAGWGAVSEFQSSSNIKMKVDLPYMSYQECQSSYNVPGRKVQLWDGQICAGGVNGKDSCKGDSGGPLMRLNGKHFELVGVVSFGPTPCGIENVAGVYTKVFHYLPWIRSNIVA